MPKRNGPPRTLPKTDPLFTCGTGKYPRKYPKNHKLIGIIRITAINEGKLTMPNNINQSSRTVGNPIQITIVDKMDNKSVRVRQEPDFIKLSF